jgi:hypothetical protein
MTGIFVRFFLFVILLSITACGLDLNGGFTGKVDGKNITIYFEESNTALLQGYFPVDLKGSWVEEKTFKEPQVWVTFDGPEDKPFRLRFELEQEGENFRIVKIKARPLGKGTKLNSIPIEGNGILSPLPSN